MFFWQFHFWPTESTAETTLHKPSCQHRKVPFMNKQNPLSARVTRNSRPVIPRPHTWGLLCFVAVNIIRDSRRRRDLRCVVGEQDTDIRLLFIR